MIDFTLRSLARGRLLHLWRPPSLRSGVWSAALILDYAQQIPPLLLRSADLTMYTVVGGMGSEWRGCGSR